MYSSRTFSEAGWYMISLIATWALAAVASHGSSTRPKRDGIHRRTLKTPAGRTAGQANLHHEYMLTRFVTATRLSPLVTPVPANLAVTVSLCTTEAGFTTPTQRREGYNGRRAGAMPNQHNRLGK